MPDTERMSQIGTGQGKRDSSYARQSVAPLSPMSTEVTEVSDVSEASSRMVITNHGDASGSSSRPSKEPAQPTFSTQMQGFMQGVMVLENEVKRLREKNNWLSKKLSGHIKNTVVRMINRDHNRRQCFKQWSQMVPMLKLQRELESEKNEKTRLENENRELNLKLSAISKKYAKEKDRRYDAEKQLENATRCIKSIKRDTEGLFKHFLDTPVESKSRRKSSRTKDDESEEDEMSAAKEQNKDFVTALDKQVKNLIPENNGSRHSSPNPTIDPRLSQIARDKAAPLRASSPQVFVRDILPPPILPSQGPTIGGLRLSQYGTNPTDPQGVDNGRNGLPAADLLQWHQHLLNQQKELLERQDANNRASQVSPMRQSLAAPSMNPFLGTPMFGSPPVNGMTPSHRATGPPEAPLQFHQHQMNNMTPQPSGNQPMNATFAPQSFPNTTFTPQQQPNPGNPSFLGSTPARAHKQDSISPMSTEGKSIDPFATHYHFPGSGEAPTPGFNQKWSAADALLTESVTMPQGAQVRPLPASEHGISSPIDNGYGIGYQDFRPPWQQK